MRLAICRFCKDSCAPHEPTSEVRDFAVKYGKRHAAHVQCAVEKQGTEWVAGLHTWQIEMLPYRLVKSLGLAPVLTAEIERRRHLNSTGQIRHNLRLA